MTVASECIYLTPAMGKLEKLRFRPHFLNESLLHIIFTKFHIESYRILRRSECKLLVNVGSEPGVDNLVEKYEG